jgi:hypothetical protein
MNLYHLEINKPAGYDCVNAFIIRAASEESARLQASAAARDESPLVWLEESMSTCEPISIEGPVGIILRDFNAG